MGKTSDRMLAHGRHADDGGHDGNLSPFGVLPDVIDQIEHPGFVEARADQNQPDAVLFKRLFGGLNVPDEVQVVAGEDSTHALFRIRCDRAQNAGVGLRWSHVPPENLDWGNGEGATVSTGMYGTRRMQAMPSSASGRPLRSAIELVVRT